ncbi:MAG: murein L,D-transpeptidase catalytic domain family protein [Flavobacterium sp.]
MKLLTFLGLTLSGLFFIVPNLPKEIHPEKSAMVSSSNKVVSAYNNLNANHFQLPNLESFSEALKGFYSLKERGFFRKDFLTIIDFSLSSRVKRLWIIDMAQNKIVFNSLVAHGKNSGEDYANQFSNKNESNKSSLGFYATGEVYQGKHGLSLKLDGLEKGVNDNARQRAIVIHGADYVSDNFLKNHSRLGKSHGCPAVPIGLSKKIIETIKDKSCLFIYHPTII